MVIFQLAHVIIRQKIYLECSYYTAVFLGVVLSNHKCDLNKFYRFCKVKRKNLPDRESNPGRLGESQES